MYEIWRKAEVGQSSLVEGETGNEVVFASKTEFSMEGPPLIIYYNVLEQRIDLGWHIPDSSVRHTTARSTLGWWLVWFDGLERGCSPWHVL